MAVKRTKSRIERGRAIAAWRAGVGLTQTELASMLGTTGSSLAQLETGRLGEGAECLRLVLDVMRDSGVDVSPLELVSRPRHDSPTDEERGAYARRVKALRERAGLSLTAASKLCGGSRSIVKRVESCGSFSHGVANRVISTLERCIAEQERAEQSEATQTEPHDKRGSFGRRLARWLSEAGRPALTVTAEQARCSVSDLKAACRGKLTDADTIARIEALMTCEPVPSVTAEEEKHHFTALEPRPAADVLNDATQEPVILSRAAAPLELAAQSLDAIMAAKIKAAVDHSSRALLEEINTCRDLIDKQRQLIGKQQETIDGLNGVVFDHADSVENLRCEVFDQSSKLSAIERVVSMIDSRTTIIEKLRSLLGAS